MSGIWISEASYEQTVYRYELKRVALAEGIVRELPRRVPSDNEAAREYLRKHGWHVEGAVVTWCVMRKGDTPKREYEALDLDMFGNIMAALRDMVRKGQDKEAEDRRRLMLGFIEQYGYLTKPWGAFREEYSEFWNMAERLVELWDRLGQAQRRELDRLKEWIRFVRIPEFELPFSRVLQPDGTFREPRYKADYAPFTPEGVAGIGVSSFYVFEKPPEGSRQELRVYQLAAFSSVSDRVFGYLQHLAGGITLNARRMGVELGNVWRDEPDAFRIEVSASAHTLAGALLLGMLMSLSSANMRICRACGRPFNVGGGSGRSARAMYCSRACASTDRSRRQRARKREASQLRAVDGEDAEAYKM
ncbi:hypothetical protein [Alicyclobacillus shizuokensis]|uniref:hypothetical protein n=1 Tax=Alicyclobacillus shizuokensis TaxID=392014 RepID=UPI000834985B|nr:hypothetical protein [Alicyclobacillus shizuokensis]